MSRGPRGDGLQVVTAAPASDRAAVHAPDHRCESRCDAGFVAAGTSPVDAVPRAAGTAAPCTAGAGHRRLWAVSAGERAATGLVYDPFSLATQLDPYPAYAMMLATAPVYRNEERDFFALSRFDDVYSGFRDWRRLSSAGGVTVDELLELTGPSILTLDPPRHDELRAVVRAAFEPRSLSRLEARLGALSTELLDDVSGGHFDFCAAFSKRLPVLAVCELMGFPRGDERMLKSWSDALIERVPDDDGTPLAAREAAGSMRVYFGEHLAQRRRRPSEDLLGLLVAGRPAESPLSEDELIGMCFLLFEAGNSTTAALLANALVLPRHTRTNGRRSAPTPAC